MTDFKGLSSMDWLTNALDVTDHTISILTMIGTIGAAATAIIVAFSAKQAARHTEATIKSDFLMRLDEQVRSFDDIHVNLRNGGDWTEGGIVGPFSPSEWARVEGYMGVFERINLLVQEKLIGIDRVDEFYGYRYCNILANKRIRQSKLESEERSSWKGFIDLGKRLMHSKGAKLLEEYCEFE
jgi:hypothetical protein